jgi:hypothetical protein
MKKGTTLVVSAIWILLLFAFSVNSRIIDIKTAKGEDKEHSIIYQSSWSADYYEDYGWPDEDTISEEVCDYIYEVFSNYSGFYQVIQYGTAGTIKSTILSNVAFGLCAIFSYKLVSLPLGYLSVLLGVVSFISVGLWLSGIELSPGISVTPIVAEFSGRLWLIGFGAHIINNSN